MVDEVHPYDNGGVMPTDVQWMTFPEESYVLTYEQLAWLQSRVRYLTATMLIASTAQCYPQEIS
jgi:hypothetical protein